VTVDKKSLTETIRVCKKKAGPQLPLVTSDNDRRRLLLTPFEFKPPGAALPPLLSPAGHSSEGGMFLNFPNENPFEFGTGGFQIKEIIAPTCHAPTCVPLCQKLAIPLESAPGDGVPAYNNPACNQAAATDANPIIADYFINFFKWQKRKSKKVQLEK
jgi:hypothetical protein